MRAKKSLGQHFLRSERALNKIIETGEIKPSDTILEIGPGFGALTDKLLGTRCLVLAVEKDAHLYEVLKTKYHKEISIGQLILIHDDILNFEFKNYNLVPSPYKLISNIPYNITGAILEKFLSAEHQPEKMVLLVQKEVGKRIVDEKGSILSISVRAYGEPRYIETVKAGSFVPAPQVDSAIIAIENISKRFFAPPAGGFSEEMFFKLLKAGFRAKRKKLLSNLAQVLGKEKVTKAFENLGLNENVRAEELSIENWGKLVDNSLI